MPETKLHLSLDHQEAQDLHSIIEDFFNYQSELKIGEQSSRAKLATHLLDVLPRRPEAKRGLQRITDNAVDEDGADR